MRTYLPLALGALVLVLGGLFYFTIGQPILARGETARLICESRILPALIEANAIVENARKNKQGVAPLAQLVAQGKTLKERLVEITQIVKDRAAGGTPAARALRGLSSLTDTEQTAFQQSVIAQAQRRCPDKTTDTAKVRDAVRAILLVLKSPAKK